MNRTWMSIAPVLLLCGCANYASFATKTSLAVLDVDTTPVEASIAFGRTEGYVGPRFNDGTVYPVIGFINASGSGLLRETQQVFAGGAAALLVQRGTPSSLSGNCENDGRPPLYLATGTSVGLRVGFADNTPLPTSFSFGYRRKESTLVPVDKTCQPSVLATHDSDAGARQQAGDAKLGLRITQYFATGAAADQLAMKPEIRTMFDHGAQAVQSAVDAFNDRERTQLRGTLDAVACAAVLDDATFERAVLVNARELGLFPESGYATLMQADNGAPRRLLYAQLLQLRAGADVARSAAIEMHRKRVCGLANPG